MARIDVIPDVHGRSDKLDAALAALGWSKSLAGWRGPEPSARLLFLGDLIDRGPDAANVIAVARDLRDAGHADVILGNHEFNAVHYHRNDPATGKPLRRRSKKNTHQHSSFLNQFPVGDPRTKEVVDWMANLPLWVEVEGLRAVHAAWLDGSMTKLRTETQNGALSEGQWTRAADETDPLHFAAEEICKGPELSLPKGYEFHDKDGNCRDAIRLKWWEPDAKSWPDVAMSVPNDANLPNGVLPAEALALCYRADAPPVVFGHYWLKGSPVLQRPNALCLDYSAGLDGPLVTYRWERGDTELFLNRLTEHPIP